jgi:hypothetical protein
MVMMVGEFLRRAFRPCRGGRTQSVRTSAGDSGRPGNGVRMRALRRIAVCVRRDQPLGAMNEMNHKGGGGIQDWVSISPAKDERRRH